MSEPELLQTTRTAYDGVAAQYAELFRESLPEHVLHRAMLGAFAELARACGPGTVADVGCGPGHVTAYLDSLGLDVFGVDLSPQMLAIAREDHPALKFVEGSQTALDVADETLGGVLSRYSVIHTPPEELPEVFAEFHRVLAPGGHMLLAFPAHEDSARLAWGFDHKVTKAYRLSMPRVVALLAASGFEERARLVEAPGEDEVRGFHQAHVLLRKPD